VGRGQCIVSLAEPDRNPRKHMNAKRRNHHKSNHRHVQKHDNGLATCVFPKVPLASEPSASDQSHCHGDFQEKNQIRNKRCCCTKESLSQAGGPKQTATLDGTSQSPPYESAVDSLPPITGHTANSRKVSRPFSKAFGSFLLSRTTL